MKRTYESLEQDKRDQVEQAKKKIVAAQAAALEDSVGDVAVAKQLVADLEALVAPLVEKLAVIAEKNNKIEATAREDAHCAVATILPPAVKLEDWQIVYHREQSRDLLKYNSLDAGEVLEQLVAFEQADEEGKKTMLEQGGKGFRFQKTVELDQGGEEGAFHHVYGAVINNRGGFCHVFTKSTFQALVDNKGDKEFLEQCEKDRADRVNIISHLEDALFPLRKFPEIRKTLSSIKRSIASVSDAFADE